MRSLHVWTLALFSLLCAPLGQAEIDLQIGPKAKIRGAIAPEGEVETLRFNAVSGTLLTFSVSAKKKAVDFDLMLLGPGDVEVPFEGAKKVSDTGTKVSVKHLPLPATGSYSLVISGMGTGDYAFSMKHKVGKKLNVPTTTLAGSSSDMIAFSAPAGAVITFKAKASKGSLAVPRFGDFGGQDLSKQGVLKPNAHTVKLDQPTAGGDLQVTLSNDATDPGDIEVAILIKVAKSKTSKLDLRGETFGKPDGGETVVGALLDAAAGGSVESEDTSGDLMGAMIDVPAGALAEDTIITISSAMEQAPGDPTTEQTAGPTVALGPAGTAFGAPVSVVVPYDPTQLPFGAVADDIQVLKVNEDGQMLVLDPVSVDAVEHTVTVEVTSFSTATTIVTLGSPQLDGRDYWFFATEFEHVPDFKTNQSWGRSMLLAHGTASFGANGPGTFVATGSETIVDFEHDGTPIGSVDVQVDTFEGEDGDQGDWDYAADGQRVVLSTGRGDEDDIYFVSQDGSFLLRTAETGVEAVNILEVLLQKPTIPASPASLAGTYWFTDLFAEVSAFGGSPAFMEAGGTFGTVTFKANGQFTMKTTERYTEFAGGSLESDTCTETDSGTFTVQPDGSIELAFFDPEDGVETDTIFPNHDGTVMVGAVPGELPLQNEGGGAMAVLVRQGSGVQPSLLTGTFAAVGLEWESGTDTISGFPVGDFASYTLDDMLTFDGMGGIQFAGGTERAIFRDPGAVGGVMVDSEAEMFLAPTVGLDGKGRLTLSGSDADDGGKIGAMAPGGNLGMWVHDTALDDDLYGMFLMIKLPPNALQ